MKMPEHITYLISRRAVEIAKQLAPRKTGKGAESLRPTSSKGEIGIEIPSSVSYMQYQNDGTEARVQEELAGKTIPIRTANGSIVFRRATESNIGKPRMITRNENGNVITSKVAWRHPGIKGKHFVEDALRQATQEWVNRTNSAEIMQLLDESEVAKLMTILRGRD